MQEKPGSQTAVLLLIVIIISSKAVTTLKSSTLRQTNYLYKSVIGLCLEIFPEIMTNVSLVISNHSETMKVSTCMQDNRNARIWNMYWKISLFLICFSMHFLTECFIWMQKETIKLKQFIKRENLVCMIRITKFNSLT